MRLRRWGTAAVLAALAAGAASAAWADGGNEEVLIAHGLTVYPRSVPVDAAGGDQENLSAERLTQDSLDAVRQYYAAHLAPGDRLEVFESEGVQGFKYIQAGIIYGQEKTIVLLTATGTRAPGTILAGPLQELQMEVKLGRHSEAEYQAVLKKYPDPLRFWYRNAKDENGKEDDEATLLYAQYKRKAMPEMDQLQHARPSADQDAKKARAQELKKKMKELKAKGDMAGIMQLAMESKGMQDDAMNDPTVKTYTQAMSRDNWALWVECLEKMRQLGWPTRLQYTTPSLTK